MFSAFRDVTRIAYAVNRCKSMVCGGPTRWVFDGLFEADEGGKLPVAYGQEHGGAMFMISGDSEIVSCQVVEQITCTL